jgi:5-methylcytosine-specific restriction enzyme subunit McrC
VTTITVREYARLTTSEVSASLDQARISPTAFDWLCELSARMRGEAGASLLQVESRRWLRLDNYVGVLESPCGMRLEIVPKHVDDPRPETVQAARRLLRRMLEAALDIAPREADSAHLEMFEHPLLEWVVRRFLESLDYVVKRGIRRDYVRVEEELAFMRGQLDVAGQMRASPARAHRFSVRHDTFSVDRPENRLLKAALILVSKASREPRNWRLANEWQHVLQEVPVSRDFRADFNAWRSDRLMAHYQAVRPWCELVLGQHMPLSLAGQAQGISLLFPMERLFERYVGRALRSRLPAGLDLVEQASHKWLCKRDGGQGLFKLKPDFLICEQGRVAMVLDAKWKLLDAGDARANHNLRQSDFYQLHSYGRKYLDGSGHMALIHPLTARFSCKLGPFSFDESLSLTVLPFDLDSGSLPPFLPSR